MTPTAFVLRMRALKEWSGLTYRQLAVRAEESGDILPSSTLASTLSRRSLPRKEVVAAFVRACGGDEASVAAWLHVREEIATGAEAAGADPHETAQEAPDEAEPAGVLSGRGSRPGTHLAGEPRAEEQPTGEHWTAAPPAREHRAAAPPAREHGAEGHERRGGERRGAEEHGGEEHGGERRGGEEHGVAPDLGPDLGPDRGPVEGRFRPGGRPWSEGRDDAVRGEGAPLDLLVGGAERSTGKGAPRRMLRGWQVWAATPRRLAAAVAGLVVVAVAVTYGVTVMLTGDGIGLGGWGRDGQAGDGPRPGTYRIRPADASFCLAEEPDTDSGAVRQLDCAGSIPTYEVQPAEGGEYWIHSLHPVMGPGCLGVRRGSLETGAPLEDDYCGHRGQSEKFRIQKAQKPAGGYRIRLMHTGECVTVPGASKRKGVQVLQLPCAGRDPGQVFLFESVPAPTGIPSNQEG